MTTILKIPLKSADEGLIRELQEKYPDAVLHIEAEVRPGERPMDEDQFWAIIDLLDWDKEKREDILRPAVQALSQFPESDIAAFDDILAAKPYASDGPLCRAIRIQPLWRSIKYRWQFSAGQQIRLFNRAGGWDRLLVPSPTQKARLR